MNDNFIPNRAILLVRISDDKAGDAAGVARQETDGRALADRLKWHIAEVIVENDVSAFKRKRITLADGRTELRTVRPGFRSALDKLASGTRDGLLAYDLDRTARDPRDLEDLIDVVEMRQPRVPVESVTGSLRLATDADITMARVMVAVANKASRDTARRVARKHEELASQGKPGGGGFRGYGFTAAYEHIPAETKIIREIAARIVGAWDGWTPEQRATGLPEYGESLNGIAADLRRRRVPTVTGAPWNARTVKSVVTKPSIAGLRAHGGEIVGPAVWPPILERDVWAAVCARLADRHRTVDLSLKRWLTGVLHCSQCEHALDAWQGNGGPRYWCATPRGGCGKIAVKAAFVEEEIERQVLDLLTQPSILERLRRIGSSDDTAADARRELAEDEAQLKQLAAMWARREITLAEYAEARKIIEKRVNESRALLTATAPRAVRHLLAGDVREAWARLTPAGRREAVLAIVPDGYEVLPHDRRHGNKFDPARLHLAA